MTKADQELLFFFNATLSRFASAWSVILCRDILNFNSHRIFAREFRKVLRIVCRWEQEAHRANVKSLMLASAPWRQRVIRDLGGHSALQLWENKQRLKGFALISRSPLREDRTVAQLGLPLAGSEGVTKQRSYPRHKLDSQGQFYLAPVHLGVYGREKYGHAHALRRPVQRVKRHSATHFRPIAVTAGELRYGTPNPCETPLKERRASSIGGWHHPLRLQQSASILELAERTCAFGAARQSCEEAGRPQDVSARNGPPPLHRQNKYPFAS